MGVNLRHRSFLEELDFTADDIRFLIDLGAQLKAAKYAGYEQPDLVGRNIRPGREPSLHHQGGHGRHPRRLTCAS